MDICPLVSNIAIYNNFSKIVCNMYNETVPRAKSSRYQLIDRKRKVPRLNLNQQMLVGGETNDFLNLKLFDSPSLSPSRPLSRSAFQQQSCV